MPKRYIAITYDVCEHNDLYEDMNEYILDSSTEMDKQVKEFAKKDVAPLIKVYESFTDDFKDITLYKQYKFKEYECDCEQ
ncbi:hypothetical protein [Virgibacillus halodenitrificans]|uniref:hypothetical protein n=1 Tax=Virgibacillus halodenitrificans TaxID=1482 RepID=UPI0002FE5013|nr:hypothetical protein [Virgibacillus halodenitrificans]MYL57591.1 hypothetical protein [Virgibacillus halodenitrificans]